MASLPAVRLVVQVDVSPSKPLVDVGAIDSAVADWMERGGWRIAPDSQSRNPTVSLSVTITDAIALDKTFTGYGIAFLLSVIEPVRLDRVGKHPVSAITWQVAAGSSAVAPKGADLTQAITQGAALMVKRLTADRR
jgi:hypothetical protein